MRFDRAGGDFLRDLRVEREMCDNNNRIPGLRTYVPTYDEYQLVKSMSSNEVGLHFASANKRCGKAASISAKDQLFYKLVAFRDRVFNGKAKEPAPPPPKAGVPPPAPKPAPIPPARLPVAAVGKGPKIDSGIPVPYMARYDILQKAMKDPSTGAIIIRPDLLVNPNAVGRIAIDPMNLSLTKYTSSHTKAIFEKQLVDPTTGSNRYIGIDIDLNGTNSALVQKLYDYESDYDLCFDENGKPRPGLVLSDLSDWATKEYGRNRNNIASYYLSNYQAYLYRVGTLYACSDKITILNTPGNQSIRDPTGCLPTSTKIQKPRDVSEKLAAGPAAGGGRRRRRGATKQKLRSRRRTSRKYTRRSSSRSRKH